MTGWSNNARKARLPRDWPARRRAVLDRDRHSCRLRYVGFCIGAASEVDHVQPGDNHALDNLQAACKPCHQAKTLAERPTTRRPLGRHPGLR